MTRVKIFDKIYDTETDTSNLFEKIVQKLDVLEFDIDKKDNSSDTDNLEWKIDELESKLNKLTEELKKLKNENIKK
jgi:vacuolar-type H+-ATPase subunit I/STV1